VQRIIIQRSRFILLFVLVPCHSILGYLPCELSQEMLLVNFIECFKDAKTNQHPSVRLKLICPFPTSVIERNDFIICFLSEWQISFRTCWLLVHRFSFLSEKNITIIRDENRLLRLIKQYFDFSYYLSCWELRPLFISSHFLHMQPMKTINERNQTKKKPKQCNI